MIQDRIEALKHALLSQIHFINEEPMPLFDCLQKDTVAPMKTDVVVLIVLNRIVSFALHRVLAS